MGVYRDQGIVLRTMRYREADRIVTLLTQSHGKLRAIIKGVRKTKSRFGARVEPFSHVDVMLYEGRSDLQVISQADLVDPFAQIRTGYDAYVCGQVMCESADKIAPDHEVNIRLVMLMLSGLRTLDERMRNGDPIPHVLQSAFLLKLLGVSGFGPSLRVCVHCGGEEGLSAFSLDEGGALCSACANANDVVVAAETISVLRMLWSTPMAEIADPSHHSGEVDGLIRRLVEYHLERRLRSLELRPA